MQRAPALPADRGFTLLEMLVVLAITGLIAALLYPQIETARRVVQQRTAREQLVAGAEAARAMAVRSGAPVALSTESDGSALVIGGTRRIALDDSGETRLAMRPQTIVFYPDGSTTGGQIMLGTGRDAAAFEVARAGGSLLAAEPAGGNGA
jgi:general secretion pathway protein H